METEPDLVFVDCDTDTVETIRGASFIIDTDISALSDDERGILTDAYDLGVFGPNACRIIERVGVPVADLWAAYKREQQRHVACPVGELAGDPHTYVAGDGVVIPWDVAGDPRTGVECCRECERAMRERLRERGLTVAGCDSCGGTLFLPRGESGYWHVRDYRCTDPVPVP